MKKLYTHLLGVAGLTVISVGFCNAQSGTLALKVPATAVVIDGSSTEWGDSLSYYHPGTKIHYAIANDKTNLYLIVKTKDPAQENSIIQNGLTFSIDAKGRKKSTFSTTFPTPINSAYAGGAKPGESLEEKRLRAATFKFRKITVDGFKDVNEESINSTNDFGLNTAIGYDKDGSLVYEEVIPLQLFHAESLAKGEWSFNIKLNGHEASDSPGGGAAPADMSGANSGGGGRGGRGGGGAPKRIDQSAANAFFANAHTSTPAIDFWGKFTLAQ